ncbi:MAG: hypothetical protein IPQ16_12145 [Geobacteraceae bacterium]|nr:hypothetical protein [Geobacteraceae bacterium]
MFLTISLAYLAAVICILLVQFRCYRRYSQMLHDPRFVESSTHAATLHMA